MKNKGDVLKGIMCRPSVIIDLKFPKELLIEISFFNVARITCTLKREKGLIFKSFHVSTSMSLVPKVCQHQFYIFLLSIL